MELVLKLRLRAGEPPLDFHFVPRAGTSPAPTISCAEPLPHPWDGEQNHDERGDKYSRRVD